MRPPAIPAPAVCPWCRSLDEWEPMSGRATVWSFVVPHPPLLPAYAAVAPYNVIVVELDDDPTIRMVGNLVTAADAPSTRSIRPPSHRRPRPGRVRHRDDDFAVPRWVRA